MLIVMHLTSAAEGILFVLLLRLNVVAEHQLLLFKDDNSHSEVLR